MVSSKKIISFMVGLALAPLAYAPNAIGQSSRYAEPLVVLQADAQPAVDPVTIFPESLTPPHVIVLSPTWEQHVKVKDFFSVVKDYEALLQSSAPDATFLSYGKARGASALLYALDAGSLPRMRGLVIDSPVSLPGSRNEKKFSLDTPVLFEYDIINSNVDLSQLYRYILNLYNLGYRNLYVLPYSSGNIAHKGLAQEVFYRLYGRPLGLEQAEES
ncbi:MAG TPA: hypothetical protein VHA52_12005, partial [Candidatus Babeliaceae bacterium]|nr:hypothetical protein [Candidatus Babeliaceae bacterium]